jgi:hypothetical protein
MAGWGAWNGPAAAYELTAAIAEHDKRGAARVICSLEAAELRGVVIALGAQARYAAHVAGHAGGAGEYRELERAAVQGTLPGSPALPLALAALDGTADPGDPPQLPFRLLAAAAVTLAMATIRVMTMAGWSRQAVAVICRRSAA